MNLYIIHQQTNPQDSKNNRFEVAGLIEAESHNEVFKKTQNWDEHWNTEEPCRSTMVGDIFEEISEDNEESVCYRVNDIGLSIVNNPNEELIMDMSLHLLNNKDFFKDLLSDGNLDNIPTSID